MSFQLADGTIPPEVEILRHCQSFDKSSLGITVVIEVVEISHGPISSLMMTCTEDWEAYGNECLMRVVAQRMKDGFEVISITEKSATLRKKDIAAMRQSIVISHIATDKGARFSINRDEEEFRREMIQYYNEVHSKDDNRTLDDDTSLDDVTEAIEEHENLSWEEISLEPGFFTS